MNGFVLRFWFFDSIKGVSSSGTANRGRHHSSILCYNMKGVPI